MCGIVGAVSPRNVVPVLIDGIRRLEYRGYDSSGLAIIGAGEPSRLERLVSTARVADLAARAEATQLDGHTGISHTRWATHGAPTPVNAHPHVSGGEIAVVHNGIIENFEALREKLIAQGYVFATQTDTEVIAHLVHAHWHAAGGGDLKRAVQAAAAEFHGAFAIAVMSTQEPGRIVGARAGSPLVVGIGADDHFLASDAAALLSVTRRIVYLEEGDIADVTRESYALFDARGERVDRAIVTVEASGDTVELGPYRHFMQKEIFEQPRAVADTLEGVGGIDARLFGADGERILAHADSVLVLACGTSYYSGLVAKQWIESLARIPCQVEIASEYRYRDSVPNPNTLVVVVSQSGETADTLAALKHAQELGHQQTLAICNVATSSMVRQTALTYLTRAGAEIGVASTKAFTTQLVAHFLLALTLAKLRGRLTAERRGALAARIAAPAGGAAGGARARAAADRVGGALREEAARALPRSRPALSDRARRRVEAEGNLVHPRRGLPGGRTEARSARAGRRRDARRRDRAERRAAGEAQVQPAGSPRPRRRALCRRRSRQPPAGERGHPRHPAARVRGPPVADRAHDPAAAPRVSRRRAARNGCGQAKESREVRHGRVRKPAERACR